MLRGAAYWSRRTQLLFLAIIAVLVWASVLVRLYRFWATTDSIDRFARCLIALFVPAVWTIFFRHVQHLNELAGQIEEKSLERLSQGPYTLAFLSCVMVLLLLY